MVWRQTRLAAWDVKDSDGGADDRFSGELTVWVCDPGVHPIEDADLENDSVVCPYEVYEIAGGEDIEVVGDTKLRQLTVTGTAQVDGNPAVVDLTFTGVGRTTRTKVADGYRTGKVHERQAMIEGVMGELWLEDEPATLTYSKTSQVLDG